LVVDDNELAAELLAELLLMCGHAVRTANDAASARDLAREFQPQVAILDLWLPDTHGCELGPQLRALPGLEALTLVALTGDSSMSTRRWASASGFAEYVTKPLSPTRLDELLGRVCTPVWKH